MRTDIGFTGTREGMTDEQRRVVGFVVEWLIARGATRAHHGDCVGADDDFHGIARRLGLRMVGHPPNETRLRAFCRVDEEHEARPYLARNADIVRDSHVMIACPRVMATHGKGGTYRTIAMARESGRPLIVVYPDGSTLVEQGSGL